MDSAGLSLANLGIRLEQATADIGLADDTIFIRRFGAISGAPTDSLGISGTISLTDAKTPGFDLRLAANNFLAIEKPLVVDVNAPPLQVREVRFDAIALTWTEVGGV